MSVPFLINSLHNRLQLVETQLAQVMAGGIRAIATAPSGVQGDSLPFPHNDRSMLATGASGSSVTMSLDEVAPLWLELLDLPQATSSTDGAPMAAHMASLVRLQPTTVDLDVHDEPPAYTTLPQLKVYYSTGSATSCVTPQLVQLLPGAAAVRSRILTAVEDTMRMHPCFNFKHFRTRIDSMFSWAKEEETRPANPKADLARSIFFNTSPKPQPTLSFFAAVCAAHALGVSVIKENEFFGDSQDEQARKLQRADDGSSRAPKPVWSKVSASSLYALSQQALQQFELSHAYDLDYLIACILQILYLLYDGKPRIAHVVYPLVGKMVNVAQMMGLSTDPDEFIGKYTLFEAELRRRVWWDVYYYDVFIADCMGQLPIIQDNTYTTRIPADVDEGQFNPSSTSLPVPVPRGSGPDSSETGFAFFALKCKLAQLVKSVKKRTFTDPLAAQESIETHLEQAEQFEEDVKSWLSELPRLFRLDADLVVPNRGPVSATLQAQRCELSIVANRMILKIFLPFLRACVSDTQNSASTPRRIVSSVVDAAHNIIHAVQLTQGIWRQTRPSAFAFYSFGRTLFDALVMSASAVVVHPTGASSGVALADLATGLDTMRDTRTAFGRSCRETSVDESIRVVERMRVRAETARTGDAPPASTLSAVAGVKRKRGSEDYGDELELLEGDFHLPYVGTGVTCVRVPQEGLLTPDSPAAPYLGPSPKSISTSGLRSRKGSLHMNLPDARLGSASPPTPGTPASPRPQIPTRGRPRGSSSATRRPQTAQSKGPSSLQTAMTAELTPQPAPQSVPQLQQQQQEPPQGVFGSLNELLLADVQQSVPGGVVYSDPAPHNQGFHVSPAPGSATPNFAAYPAPGFSQGDFFGLYPPARPSGDDFMLAAAGQGSKWPQHLPSPTQGTDASQWQYY
ncbi:hypothetical protein PENSPDRAFT_658069 [Peniophora sp. CONT]|nr:hypothetical protein PENSPDRAFT_658069 [Peniophora sp. CONT]